MTRAVAWLGRVFGRNPVGVVFAALLLLAAAPFGVIHATLVPPGQAGDEQAHAFRADSIGHGAFVGHPQPMTYDDGVTVTVTAVDTDIMLAAVMLSSGNGTAKVLNLSDLVVAGGSKWADIRKPAAVGTIGSYFPVLYLPAALAMAVAEPLGMYRWTRCGPGGSSISAASCCSA